MDKCYVYIIRCKDDSFYTGLTCNVEKRIIEHNSRIRSCLQKSKVPVKLVYIELFNDRISAAKREKEIKGWRRKKKQELIDKFTLKPQSG